MQQINVNDLNTDLKLPNGAREADLIKAWWKWLSIGNREILMKVKAGERENRKNQSVICEIWIFTKKNPYSTEAK